jgi:hypothetical protein
LKVPEVVRCDRETKERAGTGPRPIPVDSHGRKEAPMAPDKGRNLAVYFIWLALAKAGQGRYGRAWVYVRKTRAPIASMQDETATALLKEVEMTFHRKDHRRIRPALSALAAYLVG